MRIPLYNSLSKQLSKKSKLQSENLSNFSNLLLVGSVRSFKTSSVSNFQKATSSNEPNRNKSILIRILVLCTMGACVFYLIYKKPYRHEAVLVDRTEETILSEGENDEVLKLDLNEIYERCAVLFLSNTEV